MEAGRITPLPYLFVSLGLFVWNHRAFITASPSGNISEYVECDETPPDCDASRRLLGKHPSNFDTPYTYTTPGNGDMESIHHEFILSTQGPVCSLDPLLFVTDITNRTTPVSLHFKIACLSTATRVVIRTSTNLTSHLVFANLLITNCTMYWKDLSTFGGHIDVRFLTLLNWKDEFVEEQPNFFHRCVKLDDPQEGLEEVEPAISNLAKISSLIVSFSPPCNCLDHSPICTIVASTPVFARHMWPMVAEVSFVGYNNDLHLLPNAMPILQTLIFRGLGKLAAPSVRFPWLQNIQIHSLDLSYRSNPNNHEPDFDDEPITIVTSQLANLQTHDAEISDLHDSSIAIPQTPRNIYRRFLKLDAVILPPLWNKTFTGFLHRIEITCCNLSRVESHTFAHLEGLQALDLSQNQISLLSEDSFSGLTSLLTINLENNLLSTLPEDLFQGLSNLESILLRGNLLTSIDAVIFLNLHSLKRIDLSENQIRHISEDAMGREYSHFTEFAQIDLSQNELTDFPVWLLQLKFLADINLSHNRISFEGLKFVLSQMPSATLISDANRQITSTTDNFFLPATTKTIKFQNNEFTTIDISKLEEEEWYNFQLLLNYFHLDFDGNVMHCDCNIYALYDYIRSFDTAEPRDFNEIGVLPENLISITCQHPADLQGIPLGEIPINSLGCYQEVLGCPQECGCWVRTLDAAVKVICRNNNLTRLPENLPYNTVKLDYSGNRLATLPRYIPNYFSDLDVLNMSGNVLHTLDGWIFEVLGNTSQLYLHGNQLTTLPAEAENIAESLQLTLSENRFNCDCTTLWLKQWLLTRRHQILDIDKITCAKGVPQGQTVIEAADAEFVCVIDPVTISVSTVAAILALSLMLLLVIYKYRGEIKIILYMKFGCHPFDCSDDTDIVGKEFDIFVSYCHEDTEWVRQELRPRLENSQTSFRLCLHERDFVAGAAVADNISAAINTSRRMVLLLSRAFLRSHWCYMEFRQAHYKVLKNRTNYLIVVLCEDVSTEDLDEDMHLYLKTNTYLSRDCHLFWEKLRYALPKKPLTELLEGKETKWKDGWSGLEALAEAQNEAHKKARRQCQLQNGEKKHRCQYRKPKYCHATELEICCNNAHSIANGSTGDQNENEESVDWKRDRDQFDPVKPVGDGDQYGEAGDGGVGQQRHDADVNIEVSG